MNAQDELTERQKSIYDFLRWFIEEKGFSPSIREISQHFNINVNGTEGHLRALEKKGWINRAEKRGDGSGRARSITLRCHRRELPIMKVPPPVVCPFVSYASVAQQENTHEVDR